MENIIFTKRNSSTCWIQFTYVWFLFGILEKLTFIVHDLFSKDGGGAFSTELPGTGPVFPYTQKKISHVICYCILYTPT